MHTELSSSLESHALSLLQTRHDDRLKGTSQALDDLNEPQAVTRATAIDPRDLTRQQAAVAMWLSRRYRVAPEPVSHLVREAWTVGAKAGIDPTLILAVMAIESSFNPFAQSPVGAQGLMQVMTQIHDDKYEAFGGNRAAFDPVTNLRVGARVLKDCIVRAGSVSAGLRSYVGAANLSDDGGYAGKVLAEQAHLQQIAGGKSVPVTAPLIVPMPAALPPSLDAKALNLKPAAPAADKTANDRIALLR